MTVYFADRKDAPSSDFRPGKVPFTKILAQSTILFLTLPLTPDTTNLLSTPEFSLMRPDALIINVARGGIVDEEALIGALEEGKIGGAASDVFFQEPAGAENSTLVRKGREWSEGVSKREGGETGEDGRLNGRLILSPHIAWWARSSIEKLRGTVSANIEAWIQGEPKNIVA
jgi:lactate dehydrogenase-like 2-hydroxyacid dehydrogenase